MSTKLRLPAKIIAYVMECFEGLPHGHYMKRMPPVEYAVGGNKYNAFPSTSEFAVVVVIAYGDSERNLWEERCKTAKLQHSKAFSRLAMARKGYGDSSAAAMRLTGPRKARAELAEKNFGEMVGAAEKEIERLSAIIADMEAKLADWQPQESLLIRADDWRGPLFLLSAVDEIEEQVETLEEQMRALIRAGTPWVIEEARVHIPPKELSLEQVERFLLERDKESRIEVSLIIQKIKDVRRNASSGSGVPVVQQESPVDRGDDDQGQRAGDAMPVVQGAAEKAGEPAELPADDVKPNRRKRS